MMQRTISAVCRTTNRLVWFGNRGYCYDADDSRLSDEVHSQQQRSEKSVNKVTLLGRIATDPKVFRGDSSDFAVCKLVTNYSYINRETNERMEKPTFHNICSGLPYIVKRLEELSKGSRIYIEGRLDNREYVDNEGKRNTMTQVRIEELVSVDKRER